MTTKMDVRCVNFLRTMALVHGRAIERSSRPGAHRGAKRVLERAANWIESNGLSSLLSMDVSDERAMGMDLDSELDGLDDGDVEATQEAIVIAFSMLRDGVADHPMFDESATIADLSPEQLRDLDRRLLGFSGRSS